jgi:hypothetical protein
VSNYRPTHKAGVVALRTAVAGLTGRPPDDPETVEVTWMVRACVRPIQQLLQSGDGEVVIKVDGHRLLVTSPAHVRTYPGLSQR